MLPACPNCAVFLMFLLTPSASVCTWQEQTGNVLNKEDLCGVTSILVESNTSIYLILEPPAPKFMLELCFLFCERCHFVCILEPLTTMTDMTYHNLVVSPCVSTGRCVGAGFEPGYHDGAMLKMSRVLEVLGSNGDRMNGLFHPNILHLFISRWNNPLIRSPLILTSCPGTSGSAIRQRGIWWFHGSHW